MKEKHYRILKFVRNREAATRAQIRKKCECRTDDISDLIRADFLYVDPDNSEYILLTDAGLIQLNKQSS